MNDKKNNSFYKKIIVFIIILTFFMLGIILWPSIKDFYVKKIEKTNVENVKIDNNLNLNKFWEVYNTIKEDFYTDKWINKEKLVNWAIKGMVDALWDKHTEFMNNDETKKFNDVLSWDFEWIWAVVEKTWLWVKIDRLIKWSPAKKAGIRKNDVIIEANWTKLTNLDLFDAVNKIKWKAWTIVKLKVFRIWEKDLLNINVKREKIKVPSVESKSFTGSYNNIWYIALNIFWENTSEEFKKALNKLKNKDWIIIDLRDNWGWYLQSAVEILSNFVKSWKTLVETKYKDSSKNNKYLSINYKEPYLWKLVVLINWNSASASEITSLSLKENKRAILVWTKSYWKWSVQEPFNLPDWSLLKLTIAKWYVPNHKNIDWIWIQPDIKVNFTKYDYKNLFDRQLDVAKKVLEDFISLGNIKLVEDKWKKLYKQRGLTKTWSILSWSLDK